MMLYFIYILLYAEKFDNFGMISHFPQCGVGLLDVPQCGVIFSQCGVMLRDVTARWWNFANMLQFTQK